MLKYEKSNIPLAKKLRKNMTDCERKLWYEFLRSYPLRFQRQKVIGKYIADFYCAKAGLVVELDGGEHYEPEQIEYDAERTKYLNLGNELSLDTIKSIAKECSEHGAAYVKICGGEP